MRMEAVAVQVRFGIACRAGIRIVQPDAAEIGTLLQHDEVVDARDFHASGHAEASEARTQDNDLVVLNPFYIVHGALSLLSVYITATADFPASVQ